MSPQDQLLEVSPHKTDNGALIGRVPTDVSVEILSEKFRAQNPLRALRARCLDCCCGDASEVRKCVAVDCPSWPFRIARNPFRKRVQLSAEEKLRRRALLQPRRKSDPGRERAE